MNTRSGKAKKIPSPHSPAPRATILGVVIFLMAITWLVFGQTLRHPSINFDDQGYVFQNPQITTGLTSTGILWAFTHSWMQNWHPLTWISHMVDCQLFGLNAGGHHFTNVLLHTIAVLLLFLVLSDMTGSLWRSAFVAALFAIHPLRAESVVGISERKDELSAVFVMLTLFAYVRYTRKPTIARYVTMSILFACGLMSKPMLVTVPVVLLLLDYWPLERIRGQSSEVSGQVILEKIPLFILSAVSAGVTIIAQQAASMQRMPLFSRIGNAIVSYVIYIWQMFWPGKLAVFYPFVRSPLSWQVLSAAVFLIAITAVAVWLRRRSPYFVVGWLWYLSMLVPVIGIVQVGLQSHADRYTLLPQIGLYLVATWTMANIWKTLNAQRSTLNVQFRGIHSALRVGFALIIVAALG